MIDELMAVGIIAAVLWFLIIRPIISNIKQNSGVKELEKNGFKVDYQHNGINAIIAIDNTNKKIAVVDKNRTYVLGCDEIKTVGFESEHKGGNRYHYLLSITTSNIDTPLLKVYFYNTSDVKLAQARLLAA